MLYHTSLGIPASVRLPRGQFILAYSPHAERAAAQDRYGVINLPAYIDTSKASIIECEVERGIAVKILYRQAYNADYDICLACVPTTRGAWRVKTVWLNETTDQHRTLNRAAYAMA